MFFKFCDAKLMLRIKTEFTFLNGLFPYELANLARDH